MQSLRAANDVIAWAADFVADAVIESLTGSPEYMVSRIVERELLASLTDNDSG